MSGPGRPKKDEVAQRRQRIRLFLVVSAAASDQAVKRIAEKLGAGEGGVRGDLEAIRDELEHAPSDELSRDLLDAIGKADTSELLKALGKKVMGEMVQKTIDRALGSALVDALREQRQVLGRARDEEAHVALTALEVLTPQEHEALKRYRESLVPPSLKPGEFPPPPEGTILPGSDKPEKPKEASS